MPTLLQKARWVQRYANAGGCWRLVLATWLAWAGLAQAQVLEGTKTIFLNTRDQQRLAVGTVQFEPRPDGRVGFKVTMAHERFSDHFLSMKEFKCLQGNPELLCHVPYPYAQPGTVAPGDLAWLEHSLMFFYKLPTDFGAKLWNGLYFKLQPGEHGLVGQAQAIDLNRIAAPPDKAGVPPFGAAQRDELPAQTRWVQTLSLE